MSSSQLDILALEPFYGGARRVMLESLVHTSRHRWTLLKLPPRRIERRLTAAAHWFAEQLSRHWAGRCDILFTSEALNLADLYRLVPSLLQKPSVVYFHSNQLPDTNRAAETKLDLVNLNTAAAATEIWFNSTYHMKSFFEKAWSLVQRHPELMGRNPLPELMNKSQIVPPPVDFNKLFDIVAKEQIKRDKRNIFLETRDADIDLLNTTFNILKRRGEQFKLVTIGNLDGLSDEHPRQTIPEADDGAQMRAMLGSGIFLSAKPNSHCDHHAIRALAAGCWPLVPAVGGYRELLPEQIHSACLYHNRELDILAGRIQDVWHLDHPATYVDELNRILQMYEPIVACGVIDQRLEEIVIGRQMQL